MTSKPDRSSPYLPYVSFGQIGFFGIGAYVAATCQLQLRLDWYAAAAIGGLAAVIVAIPLGLIMFRLQGIFFALGMFGLASIAGLLATSSSFVGGSQGESIPIVGTPQETALVMLGLACCAVMLTGWLLHSRLGLQLMAIRDDEMATAASGVHTRFIKQVAFCLSAGLAALAGGLYIWNIGFIDPGSAFSSTFELQTILMVLKRGCETGGGRHHHRACITGHCPDSQPCACARLWGHYCSGQSRRGFPESGGD